MQDEESMTVEGNQDREKLQPDHLNRIYKRHLQGTLIRSGASAIMWVFCFAAFILDVIRIDNFLGVSVTIVYLILVNAPTLWLLKRLTHRRSIRNFSLFINALEVIGYTAIIYFIGGSRALYLILIYTALIAYVGAVGPRQFPFIIATFCSAALSSMVLLEYFGILINRDPFSDIQIPVPGLNQLMIVLTNIILLYVIAFITAYTAGVLRKTRKQLREQNIDLERSRSELSQAAKNLKQKNLELEHAINKTQESDRMKSEFLATMSHELRTPLNHIIGFTELIVGKHAGDVNETQEEYLNDVLSSSNHLLSLINDILDLSKVEAGKLELELSDVDLKAVLENSITMVKERAKNHGIQLSFDTESIPGTISADERKLKQILYNLLSNAVKFTVDGGKVYLAAKKSNAVVRSGLRWKDSEDLQILERTIGSGEVSEGKIKPCVEFSVKDNGIGIAVENQEKIFNPFEQVESSANRRYRGTGLGLSLSKILVELHGGMIWVESDGEGTGSTFRFVIPIEV